MLQRGISWKFDQNWTSISRECDRRDLEDIDGSWQETWRMGSSLMCWIILGYPQELILKVSWRSDLICLRYWGMSHLWQKHDIHANKQTYTAQIYIRLTKCLYLHYLGSNHNNNGTLFSPNLKVEESKVLQDFYFEAN